MGTGYRGCSKLRKSNPGFRGRSGPISRGKPYGRCLSLFAGKLCPRPSKEGTTFKFKMDEQNLTSTVLCAEFARQRHGYRGTSLMINSHLPWDYHTTLGIVVLWGPGGGVFLLTEVPLYPCSRCIRRALDCFIHSTEVPCL
jgi:hypothetical protein